MGKSSCWSWYILPTQPLMRNGIHVGSYRNLEYALHSDDEARAYLEFEADGVNLRKNLVDIFEAAAKQLEQGVSPVRLMGIDVPWLKASAKLFERIGAAEPELCRPCERIRELLPDDDERQGCRKPAQKSRYW